MIGENHVRQLKFKRIKTLPPMKQKK